LSRVESTKKKFDSDVCNIMTSDESAARLKNAASLLIKGGTLTSEPCPKCGNAQVRFAGKLSCISCGNEQRMDSENAEQETKVAEKREQNPVPSLQSSAVLVEEKIALLVSEISAEGDISLQKQRAELLEIYLRILEKIRGLSR
jgi:uncharacterized Zn finger protein (UPF0148 family)